MMRQMGGLGGGGASPFNDLDDLDVGEVRIGKRECLSDDN